MLRRIATTVVLIVSLISATLATAQTNKVILSLSVPNLYIDLFDKDLINDFERAHPGTAVNLVASDLVFPPAYTSLPREVKTPSDSSNVPTYFDALEQYARSADVLFVDSGMYAGVAPIQLEATRAGYFLNLEPFVDADTTLNAEDFYPSMWHAFEWDKGIWALPTNAQLLFLKYDRAVFDKAGLAYPNEKWSFNTLFDTARALKANTGVASLFAEPARGLFLRTALQSSLIEPGSFPAVPQIDRADIETAFEAWIRAKHDGLFSNTYQAPLSIAPYYGFMHERNVNNTLEAALLPGGKIGLDTVGFAISRGTNSPELAYELLKFLVKSTAIESRFFGYYGYWPAQKSLAAIISEGTVRVDTTLQPLIERGIENGLPPSELHFMDFIDAATQNVLYGALDGQAALKQAQIDAISVMRIAEKKQEASPIRVDTPLIPSLPPNKIRLEFGLISSILPFPGPEAELWQKAAQDFAARDSEVGILNLNIRPGGFFDRFVDRYDCFFLPYNAVPEASLDHLLNFDPLLAVDSDLNLREEIAPVILAQVQRDQKLWGFPVVVYPSTLRYAGFAFKNAQIPLPDAKWTVSDFVNALVKLKPLYAPPFRGLMGGNDLLILIAAYGGVPIDYRVNPPTIDFTNPRTIDAIRQVLDLAREHYIRYEAFTQPSNLSESMFAPLFADILNPNQVLDDDNAFVPIPYPQGPGIAYDLGVAYISSSTSYPDACYRWIKTIAQRPDLIKGLPALHRVIEGATIQNSALVNRLPLYLSIDKQLRNPETLSFSTDSDFKSASRLLEYWLFKAFDGYVLRSEDLETTLKDAEIRTKAYQECTFQQSSLKLNQRTLLDCAYKADPAFK